jgi:hypothetical protein
MNPEPSITSQRKRIGSVEPETFRGPWQVAWHYLMHLLLVWPVAGPAAWYFADWRILVLSSFFAVIVDTDHFVDYLLYPGRKGFSFGEALSSHYFRLVNRIYLPLHAYDLHLGIALMIYYFGHTSLAMSWLIGFIGHILGDEILGHSPGAYRFRNTLICRIVYRFDRKLYDDN